MKNWCDSFADKMLATSSPLTASHYCDKRVHEAELGRVFHGQWVCVAMRDQLSRPNDYVVRDVGGLSVVLQNTGGVVRAFHNVCSHRHSAIQTAPCGNRSLVCPYHGWTYDAEGLPVGVPANKEGFGLTDEARVALKLDEYPVEWCGPFAFVRIAGMGPPLQQHLGPAADWLRTLDYLPSAAFVRQRARWQCNWKAGLEISLEGYHADFVHAETFRPLFGREFSIEEAGIHGVMTSRYLPDVARWWESTIRRAKLSDDHNDGSYRHMFVFPNLVVGVTCGALVSVQTYWPETPTTCSVDYAEYLCTTPESTPAIEAIRRGLIAHFTEFNEQVLEEDRLAAERVQTVVAQARRPAVLGTMESRINAFHDHLLMTVGG